MIPFIILNEEITEFSCYLDKVGRGFDPLTD
jgi:hypothetical protein